MKINQNLVFVVIVNLGLIVARPGGVADGQDSAPETGHGLTAADAAEGWISLFDGRTTFGWTGAKVDAGRLSEGTSTTRFGDCALRIEAEGDGSIEFGDVNLAIRSGRSVMTSPNRLGFIRLGKGTRVRGIAIRPSNLKTPFDGTSLAGCTPVNPAKPRPNAKTVWSLENGRLHAAGGPGAMELPGTYADFLLQVEVKTRAAHANGGVFFRNPPGSFMMGYEAQIYNSCENGDPSKPSRYATGAIDDRQNARRLISRDGRPFLMTVVADGPHLATWVNGYQVTDWTDDRPENETPRVGRRTDAGTIQLQAHDPETDLDFGPIRLTAMK